MRDSHVVIVDNICQMIGRMSIRFNENRVFISALWTQHSCSSFTIALTNDPVNKIGVCRWSVRKLQSNDMRFALRSTFVRLTRYDVDAISIVVAGQTKAFPLSCKAVQALLRTETSIRMPQSA